MIYSATGLILDILGVCLIVIYSLYDFGMDATLAILDKKEDESEFISSIESKIRSGHKLTAVEKERLVFLVTENFTIFCSAHIVTAWLAINKWIFMFTPWVEQTPRKVNRFLWNLIGFGLIIAGFALQLVGCFQK